ncbi:MAG: BMP family ABC transporter substrate-binding protein, partial [Chloroflexota bacterium]
MNKLKFNWLVALVLLLALALVACGGGAPAEDSGGGEEPAAETEQEMDEEEEMEEEMEEEAPAVSEDAGSIWVLLPDSASSARWETDDRRFFEEAFDAAGVEYNIVNAEGDAATQQTQAEQAITAGAGVILMVNLDSGSGAAIIELAREAGVAIIDYDRLTIEGPGADVYVSFDNVQVGATMGNILAPLINAQDAPKVAYLNGGPTDNNATLFREGYDSVARPFIDSGDWEFVDEQSVPGWDNQEALVIFEQMLTAANNEISAVFAANDGLAGAVIQALQNAGIDPKTIPVSGQDATVGGMQQVLAGNQSMSVYKPIKAEAEAAAEAAIALLNGESLDSLTGGLTLNNGTNDIPFIALDPIGVTTENMAATVIADGFRTWDEICVGDFEQFCTDEVKMGTAMAADGSGVKVCQVTDVGGIDDKSFNATAWEGALRAEADLGIEVKFLESQQQTDYDKNLNAFIEDGCDLIVAVGFLMADATAAAAEANPDQQFAIIDVDYLDFPNLLGVGFQIDQAGFLAGYTAANASETGIIGTFGGVNIPPVTAFMDGYVMGANFYNEQNGTDVQVLGWDIDSQDGLFTGNFESTDDGRAFGESLMDEGADVILPVAGPVGLGTAAAIQERGNAWLVGVDTDWTVSAPEFSDIILTSILKRLDTAVYSSSEETVNGTFEGGLWIGNLENDGVGITDPVIAVDGLDGIIDGIISGAIPTKPGQEAMMESSDGEMAMSEEACEVDLSGESIVLYQQAGREGPLAALLGQGFAFATEDAVNWMNANGGICGAEVEVVFTETNYDTEKEVAAFESSVAADPRPFMVFTYASGATVALKDRVVEEQIVNLAAGLNGPAMYDPANGYTVGFAPIYSDQFAGYAEYLVNNWDELKPEGAGDSPVIGVIGWDNSFGSGATTPESVAYIESLGATVINGVEPERIALSPDADAS